MKKRLFAITLVLAMSVSTLTGCIKVVKTGEEAALTGDTEFSAGDNVADFWESTAIPEMEGKAIELSELLTKANGNLASLDKEDYAKYSMGTSGDLTFTVKGTGEITEVEKTKKAGYVTLKLDDYSGSEKIKIQIGSVFKGTSLRDSLNFIDYNDYKNQIEWGAVSQSINDLVQKEVIDEIGYDSFETGKKLEFTGAFTVSSDGEILITPAEISFK